MLQRETVNQVILKQNSEEVKKPFDQRSSGSQDPHKISRKLKPLRVSHYDQVNLLPIFPTLRQLFNERFGHSFVTAGRLAVVSP